MIRCKVVPFLQSAETYFRIGLKYAEKRKLQLSLKYLSKAVEIDSFNPDYQFNLGAVLAELRETDKSTRILLDILKNIDPTFTECYFGIGCNYFDLGDLKKAREYFEKYIYYDPDGYFAEDTYEILYYMNIYDGADLGRKRNKTVAKLADEGRKLLENRQFEKASTKLEKAIEIDPASVPPRNDLAVALFFEGETARAIGMTRSVILLEPENAFAQCNLALLFAYIKDNEKYSEQTGAILRLGIDCRDELRNIRDIYVKLSAGLSTVRSEDLESITGDMLKKLAEEPIKWEKEWEAVIQCALLNKEGIYRSEYEKELKNIWMNYIKKVYPGNKPVIKKSEVWAAALEYIYCNLHLIRVSKNSLAKKYNISPSSIANKLRDLSR